MENAKDGSGGAKSSNENPNSTTTEPETIESRQSSRTPFTNLTQVDADLALARTLQEQERAYMMLRRNAEGNAFGSSDWESDDDLDDVDEDEVDDEDEEDDDHDEENDDDDDDDEGSDIDEDVFDVHEREEDNDREVELDPSAFSSDEAYARALQDAEDRELADRLMSLTGVTDAIFVGDEDDSEDHDHDSNSQDTWEDIDPDELSYEELIALGEVVGTESRGLSANMIASLPSVNYKMPDNQDGSTDQCVICRLDYEEGENLTVLSCKHLYHPECINNWLKINKVCPVCSSEVSTSNR